MNAIITRVPAQIGQDMGRPSGAGVTSALHSQQIVGSHPGGAHSLKTGAVCDACVISLIVSYLEPRDADIIFAPHNWKSIPFGQ